MSRFTFCRDPIRLGLVLLAGLVVISGCASLGDLFRCDSKPASQVAESEPIPAAEQTNPAPAAPAADDPLNQRLASLRPEVPAAEAGLRDGPLRPTELLEAYFQGIARTVEKQRVEKPEPPAPAASDPPPQPAAPAPQPEPAPPAPGPTQPIRAAGAVMPVITDIRPREPEPPVAITPAPAPPIRQAVAVQPMPDEHPAPAAVAKPKIQWFDLNTAIKQLTGKLETAEKPDPHGQRLLRMLHLANRDEVAALRDIDELPTEQREIWSQLMWLTANVWGIHQRLSPEGRAAESLVALEELEQGLRRAAGLQVRTLKLCTEVTGYGVYKEMTDTVFPVGKAAEVIVYVEVENFVAKLKDDQKYHTQLQLRWQLFRKGGSFVIHSKTYRDIEDASYNHRRDFYIPVRIRWPKTLAAGEYVLKVAVDDVPAGRTDERKVAIRFR